MKNCNKCSHISTTEDEQKKYTYSTHICKKNNMRLFHRHGIFEIFGTFIKPCTQCYGDDYVRRVR